MRPRFEYARLEGERVVLRPVAEDDAPRAFELIAGRREILRWLIWDGPASVLELEERYRRWRLDESEPRFDREKCEVPFGRELGGNGSDYQFAICERAGHGFVGAISVRFRGHSDEGDLGYWIGTEYWGRGFASEAVRLADRFAFQHVGASVLCACVFAGNDASKRVLERNGFAHEHTRPANIAKRGQLIDEWYFALTRSEWRRREGAWLPPAEDVRAEGASGAAEVPA